MNNTDNFVQVTKVVGEALVRFGETMKPIFQRAADQLAQNKGYKDAAHMLEEDGE